MSVYLQVVRLSLDLKKGTLTDVDLVSSRGISLDLLGRRVIVELGVGKGVCLRDPTEKRTRSVHQSSSSSERQHWRPSIPALRLSERGRGRVGRGVV